MYQFYIALFHILNKLNVLPSEETASVVIYKVGNRKQWFEKNKRFKMHIKTKETFLNMLRNLLFHFFTFIKKLCWSEIWTNSIWQCRVMNWHSTNWANQARAIRRHFLYHIFNDQFGEAWFCKNTRIDQGIEPMDIALD